MADVFTIGGTVQDMDAMDAIPVRFAETFGQVPTLTLQRRGVQLPGLPDPWLGKSITWRSGGTLRFVGDVVSLNPHFDDRLGWVLTYQCLGFRFRLNWFPHTDDATGLDTSQFNLTLEDPAYNPVRTGRAVGQILTTVLQMAGNAAACTAAGIGNYTITGGGTIYTLPTVTATDLTALTTVPPRPIYFTGEKFGDALEALLAQWAPNHRMWVDPAGNFRFRDLRTFPNTTLTMGVDPIEPTEISRDTSNCYQRVVVRGQPIAIMALLKLSEGQLSERFGGWGGYPDTPAGSNSAKAAWSPALFYTPTGSSNQVLSTGTCTCPNTTQVQVVSSSPAETWPSGYWDQANHQGTINLYSSILGGAVTMCWSARITVCPALAAGGSCLLTIDNTLPNTQYDRYTITGLSAGVGLVWTQYKITNASLWPRLTNQSTYPQAFVNASGTGATVLSSPMGLIFRTDGATFPLPFTFNTNTGNIRFIAPTYVFANNAQPPDVWVYIPVYTNPLQAVWPPDSGGPVYDGTSYTMEGLRKTLTVTIDQWRDPSQAGVASPSATGMYLYAQDIQNALRDAVVEGEIVYYDLYAPALSFGMAASVAADYGPHVTCPTGWEGLQIPVRSVAVEWPQGGGQAYITHLGVSNRKGVYDVAQYLRPPRRAGYSFGMLDAEHGANLFAQAGEWKTDEETGAARFQPDYGRHAEGPSTFGAGAGIDRLMPGAADPTAGTGMPDFSGQLVAGMDFGAGITVPGSPTAVSREMARESAAAAKLPIPTEAPPVGPGLEPGPGGG